ncbi:MAG: hypothetical protein SF123_02160 [Chloroflexota bacterium]|nr:hypothetical protein [Chloroflexota bacterium]
MTPIAQTDTPLHLLAGFARFYPDSAPERVLRVPGLALWAVVLPRKDLHFHVASADIGLRTSFSYQTAKQRCTLLHRPLPNWARYTAGMLRYLRETGLDFPGFDVVLAGDEGDGARYEYALGQGFGMVCYTLAGVECSEAKLMDAAEHVHRDYLRVYAR